MSDDQNKLEFMSRLQKIEQKSVPDRSVMSVPSDDPPEYVPPKKLEPLPMKRRKSRSGGRAVALIFGLIFGGGAWAYATLPEDAGRDIASLTGLVGDLWSPGFADITLPRYERTGAARQYATHGLEMRFPYVLTLADGTAPPPADGRRARLPSLELSGVTTGYIDPARTHAPASLDFFEHNSTCAVTRPQPGQKLVNIRTASSGQPVPLMLFSKRAVAEVLEKRLDATLTNRRAFQDDYPLLGSIRPVDVFITDTSAPLYLALQSTAGGTLWNLHLAEGVEVAHVAMISHAASGVANLPEGAGYEALRVAGTLEDGPGHRANTTLPPCEVRPSRQPRPNWIAWQKAASDSELHKDQIHAFNQRFNAYNAWFTNAFGQSAAQDAISAAFASHVLVGPVPQRPISYTPFDQSHVIVTRDDHSITGTLAERQEQTYTLFTNTLRDAVGGDLSRLIPPPQEVPTQ